MRRVTLFLSTIMLFIAVKKVNADEMTVKVAEPFIELHTGPASGYPVFHVVAKHQQIEILKKHTSWYKVKAEKGIEGWVSAQALALTLNLNDQPVALGQVTFDHYQSRNWEFALSAGVLDDVAALSISAGWVVTENIVAEVSYTQALGNFSENQLVAVRLQHYTFPEWRLSPYLTLGTGQIRTKPRANLVQSGDESRTSDLLEAGIGVRYYLNRNFVARLEYKSLLALTDRDEQEELEEWKLGFSVFF